MTVLTLLTALGFGFRHGFDWDHIVTIGDISSGTSNRRRAFGLASMYALGHAAVVLLLGAVLILAGIKIPESLEAVMTPVIGVSLVALGLWVILTIATTPGDVPFRSRWMLLADAMSGAARRLRRVRPTGSSTIEGTLPPQRPASPPSPESRRSHDERPASSLEASEFTSSDLITLEAVAESPSSRDGVDERYGRASATGVGALHGVGIESPTQIAAFVAATNVGGRVGGLLLVATWVVGLVAANTVVAIMAGQGIGLASSHRRTQRGIGVAVGALSVTLGIATIAGQPLFALGA